MEFKLAGKLPYTASFFITNNPIRKNAAMGSQMECFSREHFIQGNISWDSTHQKHMSSGKNHARPPSGYKWAEIYQNEGILS